MVVESRGATTRTAADAPSLNAASLEQPSAFLRAAGLIFEEITATRVTGYLALSPEHHTPWGIVHGGVYTTAIESAASVGASSAVRERDQVAVGLTNTTHFLRSVTDGRVNVEATALSQGRTQQLWRVDIADESGRLIAHGEVRLQNVTGNHREELSQPRQPGRADGAARGRQPQGRTQSATTARSS